MTDEQTFAFKSIRIAGDEANRAGVPIEEMLKVVIDSKKTWPDLTESVPITGAILPSGNLSKSKL
jgi:hypothetical protein